MLFFAINGNIAHMRVFSAHSGLFLIVFVAVFYSLWKGGFSRFFDALFRWKKMFFCLGRVRNPPPKNSISRLFGTIQTKICFLKSKTSFRQYFWLNRSVENSVFSQLNSARSTPFSKKQRLFQAKKCSLNFYIIFWFFSYFEAKKTVFCLFSWFSPQKTIVILMFFRVKKHKNKQHFSFIFIKIFSLFLPKA